MMTSFNGCGMALPLVGGGLWAVVCLGGNQELVERKTSELCALHDQVLQQVAPAGLKEGDTVKVKATVRVERSPEKGPLVRDLDVASVHVAPAAGRAVTNLIPQVAGADKPAAADAAGLPAARGTPGFRQESLNVPATKSTPEEQSGPPAEKASMPPAVEGAAAK
jgi:hypothetical protein